MVAAVLRENHPDTQVPPAENPMCAAFEEYEEVPKTVPLGFGEYDVTWVTLKLSVAADALGAESIELRNWIILFGCASEELMVVVVKLTGCRDNLSPPLGRLSRINILSYSSAG